VERKYAVRPRLGRDFPRERPSRIRSHHLHETFWGWRDEQLRDGTIIWTAPPGKKCVTHPAEHPRTGPPVGMTDIVRLEPARIPLTVLGSALRAG